MAKKILTDINLNQNEIQNSIVQNLASNPSNPKAGQMYFNTTTNRFRVYNGTSWDEMGTGGGTVTSVSASSSDNSMVVSGSPITTSGTIDIKHNNEITAQTTSGIYPIKIDKNGHITEYGDAVGVVSTIKDGLAPAISSSNTQTEAIAKNDLVFDATTGKYAKLPSEAFTDTTYEDGTAGYVLKAKQDSEGNQINTTYAPLSSPALTGTPTAPTATKGTSTTQLATTAFVANAISDLEGAMHYKGTVTTATGLPTDAKNGDTYKVAEEGTYSGQAAKIGDLFIAVVSGSTLSWTYVPSADDTAVTSITAGEGLTGGTITTTGTIALAETTVTAGEYQGITIDKYGRVTAAEDKGYTTNEGTVTSVGITAGDGISVSGSPVTTSGNITVGLEEVLSSEKSQDVYPIAIDKYGRVTSVGTSVVLLKKYSATITGNSTTKEFTITHNLGSKDVTIQVYDGSSNEDVIVDTVRSTDNTAKISFATAPTTGTTYRVVVIG